MKPLLFLDVDGPLNPYLALRRGANGYTRHMTFPSTDPHGLPVLLNHGHGERLLRLQADIVWLTSWNDEANEWIGPHIGLPKLEVLETPRKPVRSESRVHPKTDLAMAYADGRPFVWIDDECTTWDWQKIQKEYGPHGCTHLVSPSLGLTSGDFWQLNRKLQEVMKACERDSQSKN